MYLSGLEMKVAILNKKLFKTWRKNTWHPRHQREKELAQTVRRSQAQNQFENLPHINCLIFKSRNLKSLKGTPIITVHQGKEPITFTGFFLGWDDEFWDTDVSDKLQYS